MYSELIVKTIIKQLLSALCYMHSMKIAHRDIKMDNIVFIKKINAQSQTEDVEIKIIVVTVPLITIPLQLVTIYKYPKSVTQCYPYHKYVKLYTNSTYCIKSRRYWTYSFKMKLNTVFLQEKYFKYKLLSTITYIYYIRTEIQKFSKSLCDMMYW